MATPQRLRRLAFLLVLGCSYAAPLPAKGQVPCQGIPAQGSPSYRLNSPEPPLNQEYVPGGPPRSDLTPVPGPPYGPRPIGGPQSGPGPARPGINALPSTPTVTVRVDAPAQATAGQELEYRIVLENTPRPRRTRCWCAIPCRATLALSAPSPSRRPWSRTSEPGKWDPSPAARPGKLCWSSRPRARATSAIVPASSSSMACAFTTKLGRAELRIEKRGPRQAVLNDIINCQLIITNNGTAEARGLLVIDSLPDGLALLDSKAEGQPALEGRHTRRWERQSLAAGQSPGSWNTRAGPNGRNVPQRGRRQGARPSGAEGEP